MSERVSEIIAGWIGIEAGKGNMLPRSREEIQAEIATGRGRITFNGGSQPIAYCRMIPWPESGIEVGSLVVDPTQRRQGIGTRMANRMVAGLKEEYPRSRIFCLAENSGSQELFEKAGGRRMEKDELGDDVWDLCFKPGAECAHSRQFPNCPCVPFDLTNLGVNIEEGRG